MPVVSQRRQGPFGLGQRLRCEAPAATQLAGDSDQVGLGVGGLELDLDLVLGGELFTANDDHERVERQFGDLAAILGDGAQEPPLASFGERRDRLCAGSRQDQVAGLPGRPLMCRGVRGQP